MSQQQTNKAVSSLLTIEHLTKSYTERLLFNDTSFSVSEGEKLGLIGVNGTGKSTLLKIVAGVEDADAGSISRRRNLTVAYLAQNPKFQEGDTILESIARSSKATGADWDMESQAKTLLTRMGIYEFDERVETLSGGQRKRAALVSTLMSDADLLILDEPTNHLDSEMADWLEDYLKKFRKALLMITHDRYFLDSVANRIVELDNGKLYSYQANYEGYLKLKAERIGMEQASERKRQSILKLELAWMQRGARARSTKQKGRIQRFEAMRDQKGPEEAAQVELESVSSRLGRTTIQLEHLSKAYGDKVLMTDFSYIFLKNDRIGIIGPNGSGKSTLMKIISGWEQPDSGRLEIGQTVKLGYFSQENEAMDESLKVIDYIRKVAEYVQTRDGSISASQMLERFLFPPAVQYTTISQLSGGEKRRLYLLRILMDAPNVLLLDEPTNDLDIRTLTILEDYLDGFQGIVAAVSHDRYFLDRVVNRIFAFEGNGTVTQYEGGFTDYQAAYQERHPEQAELSGGDSRLSKTRTDQQQDSTFKAVSQQGRGGVRKLKFSYQEQKDWETIETDIAELEAAIAKLDVLVAASASDYGKLQELMNDKETKEQQLEEKLERWMYLTELAEKIAAQ